MSGQRRADAILDARARLARRRVDLDPDGVIQASINERVRRHRALVEAVCVAAIQGGQHGVRVRWNADTTIAEIDPTVPYGQIHEHPYGQMEKP